MKSRDDVSICLMLGMIIWGSLVLFDRGLVGLGFPVTLYMHYSVCISPMALMVVIQLLWLVPASCCLTGMILEYAKRAESWLSLYLIERLSVESR